MCRKVKENPDVVAAQSHLEIAKDDQAAGHAAAEQKVLDDAKVEAYAKAIAQTRCVDKGGAHLTRMVELKKIVQEIRRRTADEGGDGNTGADARGAANDAQLLKPLQDITNALAMAADKLKNLLKRIAETGQEEKDESDSSDSDDSAAENPGNKDDLSFLGIPVATLKSGSSFGDIALLKHCKRTASIVAGARRDSAEHFFGSNALHCTAMARILIPAECSAVS